MLYLAFPLLSSSNTKFHLDWDSWLYLNLPHPISTGWIFCHGLCSASYSSCVMLIKRLEVWNLEMKTCLLILFDCFFFGGGMLFLQVTNEEIPFNHIMKCYTSDPLLYRSVSLNDSHFNIWVKLNSLLTWVMACIKMCFTHENHDCNVYLTCFFAEKLNYHIKILIWYLFGLQHPKISVCWKSLSCSTLTGHLRFPQLNFVDWILDNDCFQTTFRSAKMCWFPEVTKKIIVKKPKVRNA